MFQRRQPSFLTSIRGSRRPWLPNLPRWRQATIGSSAGCRAPANRPSPRRLSGNCGCRGAARASFTRIAGLRTNLKGMRWRLRHGRSQSSRRESRGACERPIRHTHASGRPRGPGGNQTGAGRSSHMGRRFCRGARGVSWPDGSNDQRRLERSRPTWALHAFVRTTGIPAARAKTLFASAREQQVPEPSTSSPVQINLDDCQIESILAKGTAHDH